MCSSLPCHLLPNGKSAQWSEWQVTVYRDLRIIENEDPCAIHAVTLTDLRPGTTYHYRVCATSDQGEQVDSEVYPLKMAVEAHMPFSFAVTSETGGYGDDEINRRIFDQVRCYRPDFLLMVGDAVKYGSRYEDWDKWFFAPAEALLCNTPFYLCFGNHEEKSPWFYRFVSYPAPKNYYSFDYGNAHFTALDSTDLVDYTEGKPVATVALTPGLPQYEFLVDDLRSTRATWKIVFFHYPPYVSGDYTGGRNAYSLSHF